MLAVGQELGITRKEFGITREKFAHEKCALWAKKFVTGMWIEIAFLLPRFFLLGLHPRQF